MNNCISLEDWKTHIRKKRKLAKTYQQKQILNELRGLYNIAYGSMNAQCWPIEFLYSSSYVEAAFSRINPYQLADIRHKALSCMTESEWDKEYKSFKSKVIEEDWRISSIYFEGDTDSPHFTEEESNYSQADMDKALAEQRKACGKKAAYAAWNWNYESGATLMEAVESACLDARIEE